jgi:hypothetical protein
VSHWHLARRNLKGGLQAFSKMNLRAGIDLTQVHKVGLRVPNSNWGWSAFFTGGEQEVKEQQSKIAVK